MDDGDVTDLGNEDDRVPRRRLPGPTTPLGLILTDHVRLRMRERRFVPGDLDFVVAHGQCLHREGLRYYFLGRRQLNRQQEVLYAHLVGTFLVVSGDGVVLTCYRNGDRSQRTQRKRETAGSRRRREKAQRQDARASRRGRSA